MKGEDTTERVRMMSQKRNRKWMATMEWNERIGMEMEKSECDWSGWEEEWDGNGWKWMDVDHRCGLKWKAGMSGDEGDGVEKGVKKGWNNE